MPPPPSQRLRYRDWTVHDAELAIDLYRQPLTLHWLMPERGGAPPPREEVIERLHARIEQQRRLGFTFGVVEERDTGAFVGAAGLALLARKGPEIEVGYHIHDAFAGRGYATEAARAYIEWGFAPKPDGLGLDRIVAIVRPDHAASRRVLEKCGLRECGTFEHRGIANTLLEILPD